MTGKILDFEFVSVGCLSHRRGHIIIQRSDPISAGQIGTFRHKKCPCAQDLTLIRFRYLAVRQIFTSGNSVSIYTE